MALLLGWPLAAAHDSGKIRPAGKRQKKEVIAVSTETPVKLDGVLDEPIWRRAQPAADFIQREPNQGQPATEKTEVRILYDRKAIYFGVYVYDSEPEKLIINSLEQDFTHGNDDGIGIYLDTFDDDRNAFVFYTNPAGAKKEVQAIDEGRDQNVAWEDVWDVKTRITEEGWFAEVRIPFKSLRFPRSKEQHWGINFQRRVRRRNEQSDWSPIPRRFSGYNLVFAGDLKGIENVRPGRNFKLKPFVTAACQ
ncbi:MAG: carbohydrate binding family 9 domain-containing protein [Acidobacteria bacterium]|nr:carbohydrate binding family 9 domain-containing protein [Acidobacteriota bacterium]